MGKPSPSPPRPLPQAQDMVTTPKKPKLTTKGLENILMKSEQFKF